MTFTASDFGRTLMPNGNGTDHGWGSMHFVLGGAVLGGRYYGTPPAITETGDGLDEVGRGRLRPTTSVDQLGATLGAWFGLTDEQLDGVFPNLENWEVEQRNLGFL